MVPCLGRRCLQDAEGGWVADTEPKECCITGCPFTVSDSTTLILARMSPTHLLTLERKRVSEWRSTNHGPVPRAAFWRDTINRWQTAWLGTSKARWTKRVIPDLVRWWYYGPQSISHHMVQALTGHGCFQENLYFRGRAIEPSCVHCPETVDSVEHTIFRCAHWNYAREVITTLLGRPPTPEDVSEFLCSPSIVELPEEVQ